MRKAALEAAFLFGAVAPHCRIGVTRRVYCSRALDLSAAELTTMHGLAEMKPFAGEENCAESTPCPACTAPLNEPKSTNYRGLGRIEHEWQCHRCGESFRTNARMAGIIDLEPQESVAAAR